MKIRVIMFLALLLTAACIDRINFTASDSGDSQLVVDGLITNEPGPYTVRLSLSSRLDGFLQFRKLVTAKRVTLSDNAGNSEILKEKETGTYQTGLGGIQGVIGRYYSLKIETQDGKVYESIPDKMNPVGELDSLYYEKNTNQPLDAPTQYGLKVYVDGRGLAHEDNLYRWKFEGTYLIYTTQTPFSECKDDGPNESCTCCVCWVTRNEDRPRVSENRFISNGIVKRIEIGYVPVEYFPFKIKYRIKVKQMSLSRMAFDYWKIIQSQKEGAASLFQPPTGKTRTNILEKTGSGLAQGIFYAAAVKSKQTYLTGYDVKVKLNIPLIDNGSVLAGDCRNAFLFSTTTKPSDWN